MSCEEGGKCSGECGKDCRCEKPEVKQTSVAEMLGVEDHGNVIFLSDGWTICKKCNKRMTYRQMINHGCETLHIR